MNTTTATRRLIGTVLIVEGDRLAASAVGRVLHRAGFRIRIVRGNASVASIVSQAKPDLVVLDFEIPGVDGFRVLDYLRTPGSAHDPRIVIVSALPDDLAQLALALGADDVITSPLDPDLLMERVLDLLDVDRAERPRPTRTGPAKPGLLEGGFDPTSPSLQVDPRLN